MKGKQAEIIIYEAGTYDAVFLVDFVHIHEVIFIQVGSCRGTGMVSQSNP